MTVDLVKIEADFRLDIQDLLNRMSNASDSQMDNLNDQIEIIKENALKNYGIVIV